MEARSPTAAPSAPLSPHELAQQRVHEARVASLPPLTPADRRHSRRILFERFQQSKAMEKRSITRISVALALVMGVSWREGRGCPPDHSPLDEESFVILVVFDLFFFVFFFFSSISSSSSGYQYLSRRMSDDVG